MRRPHQRARVLILAHQDGLLSAAQHAELQAHLAVCPDCSQYANQIGQLDRMLTEELPAHVPAPHFSDAALALKLSEIQHQTRRNLMNQRISQTAQKIIWVGSAIVLLIVFVLAVSRLRPQPTAPLPVNETSTPATTPTVEPTAMETPVETPVPSATVQTGPGEYANQEIGIAFQYPAGWTASSDGSRYEGSDGFFAVEELSEPAISLRQACERIANDGSFGETPAVELKNVEDRTYCTILTSLNRAEDNRSAVVIGTNGSETGPKFYVVSVDPTHLENIVSTLSFTKPVPTPAASWVVSTPDPNQPAPDITPAVLEFAGLTIEEYPIVSRDVDTPGHFEFNDRIPAWVFDKHRAVREYNPAARVEQNNQLLEPFGYKFVLKEPAENLIYDLYQSGQVVQADVVSMSPISISESGEKFVLQIDTMTGESMLLQEDGPHPWNPGEHWYIPAVYVGNDLTWVENTSDMNSVAIRKTGEVVFNFKNAGMSPENPIKSLWAWGERWVAEIDGLVFIDGELLNDQLGASEAFNWQMLQGKPFFYFRKDGKVQISYDGEVLPVEYDDVMHYQCCEASAFNPGGNNTMAWFYALRDNTWYYVEIGQYH